MFPIDPSKLPALRTRKALLVIDPQNDFLDDEGALPLHQPVDLAETIAKAAQSFRANGVDIIWVRSQFDKIRSINNEMILTSDLPLSSGPATSSKGRSSRASASQAGAATAPKCPEGFLSLGPSSTAKKAVRPGTTGIDLHPAIQAVVLPRDQVLVKSFYSAFKNDQLLRLLRMRIVTELYICGSLTNVSVMATAYDAASHGLVITIVKDCCGFRSSVRHHAAIRQIVELTGCDVLNLDELSLTKEVPAPRTSTPKAPSRSSTPGDSIYPSIYVRPANKPAPAATYTELDSALESLSIQDRPSSPSRGRGAPLVEKDERKGIDEVKNDKEDGGTDAVADKKHSETPTSHVDDSPKADALPQRPASGTPKNIQEDTTTTTDAALDIEKELHKLSLKDGIPALQEPSHVLSPSLKSEPSTSAAAATLPQKPEEKDTSSVADRGSETTPASVEHMKTQGEPLCEGDSRVIYNILPAPLADDIFAKVRDEVQWQRMSHQGGEVPRLVAVQGQVDEQDGSVPVYRHPSDESPPLLPFSATVAAIREVVEQELGHPLNHALIQFYRHGNDYISEHSDKTLDIAKDSFIANVSLGAERTMVLRTKRAPKVRVSIDGHDSATATATTDISPRQPEDLKRQSQRAALPHNSLMKMGLQTNMKWLHGIRQDKRQEREKTAEELAYAGGRISLTFRRIGTFLDGPGELIWGQGATGKTRDAARGVVNGQTPQAVDMLRAFGRENQLSDFDWDLFYGKGFDVLHITASPRVFLSADPVVNMRVQMMLAEYGISYARGSMATASSTSPSVIGNVSSASAPRAAESKRSDDDIIQIKLIDTDEGKSTVQGDMAIMLYLDRVYGSGRPASAATAAIPADASNGATLGAGPISTMPTDTEVTPRRASVPKVDIAKVYTRFQQALNLKDRLRAVAASSSSGGGSSTADKTLVGKGIREILAVWETYALAEATAAVAPTVGGLSTPPVTTSPETSPATTDARQKVEAGTKEEDPAAVVDDRTTQTANDPAEAYIASQGSSLTLADFALWPVLHDMVARAEGSDLPISSDSKKGTSADVDAKSKAAGKEKEKEGREVEAGAKAASPEAVVFKGLPALRAYYTRVGARQGVARMLNTITTSSSSIATQLQKE